MLGTKDTVDAAVAVFPGTSENLDVYAKPVLQTLQIAVGPVPEVRLASGFLGITLMNINAFWHPTLLWHRWRDWDGTPVEGPPPLLYETAPDDLACDAMSAEIAAVVAAIRARYPPGALVDDMSSARPVRSWFLDSYGHDPNLDKTSTATMMRTNPAYRGLTHPMRFVERKKSGDVSSRDAEHSAEFENSKHRKKTSENLLVPDFSHRYVAEDVGYGLAVMRGVAELAGVPTPTVDAVIVWAQKQAGLSFLVEREIDKPGGELSHPAADEPGSQARAESRFGAFFAAAHLRGRRPDRDAVSPAVRVVRPAVVHAEQRLRARGESRRRARITIVDVSARKTTRRTARKTRPAVRFLCFVPVRRRETRHDERFF